MGLRRSNGIPSCFLAYSRSGVGQAISNSFLIFQRNLTFLFVGMTAKILGAMSI